MEINIVNTSGNPLPEYQSIHAAGMDLRAHLGSEMVIKPMERVLVPTGIFIELPEGYEAQVRPRSGLSIRSGISILNSPGTIDSDYRGEIKVILVNLGSSDYIVRNGDRIAQMVISRYEKITWKLSEKLNETTREQGGFGSTGI
ncbi:MAG TPA: dUTP diphosphatase [Cyclobacteriaceae bacterium]|nr:dUTP diphosphatase [Cyclobacteriaceae bacterium]